MAFLIAQMHIIMMCTSTKQSVATDQMYSIHPYWICATRQQHRSLLNIHEHIIHCGPHLTTSICVTWTRYKTIPNNTALRLYLPIISCKKLVLFITFWTTKPTKMSIEITSNNNWALQLVYSLICSRSHIH